MKNLALPLLSVSLVIGGSAWGQVQVVSGSYGVNCGAAPGNKTAHLAQACNGQRVCRYTIDHTVIGDPAIGCGKEYVAQWRCANGHGTQEVKARAEAGFGSVIELACRDLPAPLSKAQIEVISGSYGVNCGAPAGNKTAHLAKACDGRGVCRYRIDHTVIGDPAVGCGKEYVAQWRCSLDREVRTAKAPAEAGFGTVLELSCSGGGEQAPTPQAEPAGIQVQAASYGLNCRAAPGNVTRALVQACNGRGRCDYVVDYTVLGDPAVGCPKEYLAEWRCAGVAGVYRLLLPGEAGFRSTARLVCP